MSGPAPPSTTFPALGTSATVAVTDAAALAPARDLLAAELAALDEACSRFRDDSELRRLEHADGQPMTVSPLLADALAAALRAARLTGGRVTPVLGRSLRLAGYDRDASALRPRRDPPRFLPAPDWRAVELDTERRQVALPPGVALDLGATAKAFAADRAAVAIAGAVDTGVLVALGGDLRVAGPAPAGGWPVWVDDAHDRRSAGAADVVITTGGLATSSTTVRRWRRAGQDVHHILDPATGRPAAGPWRTASVAAGTCLDANAASTAAILLGAEAPRWLAARGLPARLVAEDGAVAHAGAWPAGAEPAAA